MRRSFVIASVVAFSVFTAGAALAGPSIMTISGHSTTSDIADPPGGTRTVGLNVKQAADGSWSGTVSVKTVNAGGGTYSNVRGDVVCVLATAGAPGGDFWEIRYQVTRASGGGAVPVDSFDSLFVRDNPAGDQTAYLANPFALGNPACGDPLLVENITWDDVTRGAVRIRS